MSVFLLATEAFFPLVSLHLTDGWLVGLAVAVAVALAVGIIATLACWLRAALVKPSSQEPSAVLAKGGQAADGKDTQDRREMLVIPS